MFTLPSKYRPVNTAVMALFSNLRGSSYTDVLRVFIEHGGDV